MLTLTIDAIETNGCQVGEKGRNIAITMKQPVVAYTVYQDNDFCVAG